MNLRTKAIVATGVLAGILTVRWVRNRRSTENPSATSSAEEARKEVRAAKAHAAAATSHARTAGQKASEYAREEIRTVKH